jgi:hypothetical protein
LGLLRDISGRDPRCYRLQYDGGKILIKRIAEIEKGNWIDI